MIMNGKYYPNNWEAIKEAPDEYFEPCTWQDFEEWKLSGWDLPSSVSCIIRAHNKDTGKVYEHTYRQAKRAKQRLLKYMDADDQYEITICDHNTIHLLSKEYQDDDSDD